MTRNGSSDVMVEAQFRVDEYNIKKEVPESTDQTFDLDINPVEENAASNLLKGYFENGWMADLGLKSVPLFRNESQSST